MHPYEAIESFLTRDTWFTPHPNERKIFLHLMFNKCAAPESLAIDKMKNFMYAKLGLDESDQDSYYAKKVQKFCDEIEVVRDYLEIKRWP